MQGYPDDTFAPDGTLTRAEFVTALANYLGLAPKEGYVFNDTDGHWAQGYVAAMVEAGIVSGYDGSTFGVDDLITRQEIALMLVRAFNPTAIPDGSLFADDDQIADWAKEAVYAVRAMGWMLGDDEGFRPQDGALRGEIATIFARLWLGGVGQ